MTWNEFVSNNFLVRLAAAAAELLIGFFLGPFCKRLILKLNKRKGMDEGVLTFTGSFINIFIRILSIIIALGQIGADITAVVGIFSAMGLGVSLALKENMANVAGGLQILLTKPFKVGDYIACGTEEGTVVEIEIMFSTLKTFDNQLVVIPNSMLVSSMLINYSAYPSRRIVTQIPVSAVGDYQSFRDRLMHLMESHAQVLKDPAPHTVIGDITPQGNSLSIKAICYTLNDHYWDVKFELNEQIQALRAQMELEAPASLVEMVSQ